MKKFAAMAISGFAFSLISLPAMAESQREVIAKAQLKIFPGQSYWTVDVQPDRSFEGVEVQVDRTVGCSELTYRIDYQDSASGQWQNAIWNNGLFKTSGGVVSALNVWFYNNKKVTSMQCEVTVFATSTKQPPKGDTGGETPVGAYKFAGVLKYNGGFTLKQEQGFGEAFYAQHIAVLIPDYCAGVEVVELGVAQQDRLVQASKVDSKLWRFSYPVILDRVQISLNGPADKACEIPVFVYDQKAGQ